MRPCAVQLALLVALAAFLGAAQSRAQQRASDPRQDEGQTDWQGASGTQPATNPQRGHVTIQQRANQPPAPFRLTPEQEQHVDNILLAWERTSSAVKTYKCDFTRWEYDAVFGPKDGEASIISTGEIRYMSPDKGLFKVTTAKQAVAQQPARQKDSPKWDWKKLPNEQLEHWVCDGKSVFELRHKDKQLVEQALPPELQGTAIADGPLPFVFGAKAAKLKQRYWIREIESPNPNEQIWLEAYPRFQADAANFQKVEIILSRKELMPVALQLYDPGSGKRTVYQLEKPAVNGVFDNFVGGFIAPKLPFGYKKVVQRADDRQQHLQAQPQQTRPQERSARKERPVLR
jgi:TIGR03009 family protein